MMSVKLSKHIKTEQFFISSNPSLLMHESCATKKKNIRTFSRAMKIIQTLGVFYAYHTRGLQKARSINAAFLFR